MIDPQHVFVADAKPVLALPPQRCAVVCGAGSALGEALLNQLLASPRYTRVYVATSAALPATVAHLQGFAMQAADFMRLAADHAASSLDFMVVAQADTGTASATLSATASRQSVYAPLPSGAVPALLRHIDTACAAANAQSAGAVQSATTQAAAPRWLLASNAHSAAEVGSWASAYSAHTACMVFGLAQGRGAQAGQNPYQFKPQGASPLDRLGVWVLNVLSSSAHGMLNPQKAPPLTTVKTAQRLVQRWNSFTQPNGVSILTASDLA